VTSPEGTPITIPLVESGRIAIGPPRSRHGLAVPRRPAVAGRLVIPAAAISWVAAAGITLLWPDQAPWYSTVQVGFGTGAIGVLILLAALMGLVQPAIDARLRRVGPWLLVLGMLAVVWQVTTAKLALLPLPYFPPPQAIVDGFEDD
jgi:NitT/TauT family transport system permease protein